MCGICGLTSHNSEKLASLQHALLHRGPDEQGNYLNDGISMGHTRLSIIDLSSGGAQPKRSNDGRYVISYNGELYNYRELRNELNDSYKFVTESDTEVLLAAYVVWGSNMLSKLNGMFALAIWDTKTESLFLCRDHMGIKPLYYLVSETFIAFASEAQALIQFSKNQIDRKSMSLLLGINYVPSPNSLIVGIKKIPPGHYAIIKDNKLKLEQYFDVFSGDDIEPTSNSVYEAIDCAVARQLVAERPLGIFLSGGIDSSVVLHHASQHQQGTKTFSVEYELVPGAEGEAKKFNTDARLAEKTAQYYGADHQTFSISLPEVRDNLEKIIKSLDEPVANPTAIAQYFLSQHVRESGVVVALGGDGGDELFGGYTRHRAMMAAHYYHYLPSLLRTGLSHVHPRLAKLALAPGLPLHLELMVNDQIAINRITKRPIHIQETARDFFSQLYQRAPNTIHPLDQFMRVDRRTWLAEESLARSDRSSMAHGLELRVPLLDIDVVRLADTISSYQKTTPWQGKKILRNIYKTHLPEYLYKQPKRGWISPGAKWFRDPVINEFCQQVFSDDYYDGLSSIINWSEVQAMLQRHTDKEGYHLYPLWNLLVLQIWSREQKLKL